MFENSPTETFLLEMMMRNTNTINTTNETQHQGPDHAGKPNWLLSAYEPEHVLQFIFYMWAGTILGMYTFHPQCPNSFPINSCISYCLIGEQLLHGGQE